MTGQAILWTHALAALSFAVAALAVWRRPSAGWPRSVFAGALILATLWSLAVAGIGSRDVVTRCMEAARDLGLLGFAFALVRRNGAMGWTLAAVYLVVAAVVVAAAVLGVVTAATQGQTQRELEAAMLVFRLMAAAGALILARHLHGASLEHGAVRPVAVALALIWSADLIVFAVAYLHVWDAGLIAVRGMIVTAAALLLGVATRRRDGWALALSRPAASRALIAVAVVVYVGALLCLSAGAGALGGRAWQAGVVIGGAAALVTLLSTSWLGAWTKVKLAKHLFRHRYDYRVEWQRFTATLGGTADNGEPLEARVIAAVAALLDAPKGLLLRFEAGELRLAGGWQWRVERDAGAALPSCLAEHRRIVELDAVRAGLADADTGAIPAWMLAEADAWALVPLIHGEAVIGAVLLARPPVARRLDWEDFDLLRVAGRQAASYLAEDRAHRALAEAERFDEFNRRFAFILHDIKNLVSQQLLVARNAERHAGNPAFRADMVMTLKESADRMTALLAKLSHRDVGQNEALVATDCAALAWRVARAQKVICKAEPVLVLAQPQRLEQVISHLVQNAVEASAADRPVRLTVAVNDAEVIIEIADEGVGMSPAFIRDELFRPFSSTKAGGFGIGAFEARQLVTAMGGRLSVTSREGEGSCFRIVLPAAPALEQAA